MVSCGRGRCKTGIPSVGAEFFKIFVPQLNSHQLLIPPDFFKYFSRTLSEKVILKDISGRKWQVDVAKTPKGVFLKNGWKSFVSYHYLKVGDLLVFRYDGNYSFIVKIFGSNGCKKESTFAAHKNIFTDVKNEEEIEAKPNCCKRPRPHEEGLKEVNELKAVKVASERPENIKCPYIVVPPIQKREYGLRLSNEVTKKHNTRFDPETVLCDANGKEWPVKATMLEDGRTYIGKGWMAFQRENNVAPGDSFIFSFKPQRLCSTIHVQILRHVAQN